MDRMKKLVALLLSALLLAGMFGTVTNAAGTNPAITDFVVTAKLEMDPNVEHYPDFEFQFNFEQVTSIKLDSLEGTNLDSAEYAEQISTVAGPKLDTVSISFAAENVNTENVKISPDTGCKVITLTGEVKSSGRELTGEMFPTTGLYLYKVSERELVKDQDWEPMTDGDWLEQSKAEYIIVIPVVYDDDAQAKKIDLEGAVIVQTKTQPGAELSEIEKVDSPVFANIYQRIPDTTITHESYELKISKTVTGALGDREKPFTFTIHITKNTTERTTVTEYHAAIYQISDTDGEPDELISKEVSLLIGKDQTFQLKHNQYLIFKDLPVGSHYTIQESDNDDYVTTAAIMENGVLRYKDAQENVFEAEKYVIGEETNRVDVTNAREKTVLTGIVTDNLSFILLIVIAVLGITAYTVMKRRLRSR